MLKGSFSRSAAFSREAAIPIFINEHTFFEADIAPLTFQTADEDEMKFFKFLKSVPIKT